jgi:hypothetical protein
MGKKLRSKKNHNKSLKFSKFTLNTAVLYSSLTAGVGWIEEFLSSQDTDRPVIKQYCEEPTLVSQDTDRPVEISPWSGNNSTFCQRAEITFE